MVEPTMDITSWLRKQLEEASPDLLRSMVHDFAETLMGAEAEALSSYLGSVDSFRLSFVMGFLVVDGASVAEA